MGHQITNENSDLYFELLASNLDGVSFQLDILQKNQSFIREQLGISLSAFTLANKAFNKLMLLENQELQEYAFDVPSVPFVSEQHKDFIDLLFIGKREIQRLIEKDDTGSEFSPEFYENIYLSSQSSFEYKELYRLRKEYKFLYCPKPEVLFFTLSWRFLLMLGYKFGFSANISKLGDLDYFQKTDIVEEIWQPENFNYESVEREVIDLISSADNNKIQDSWAALKVQVNVLSDSENYKLINELILFKILKITGQDKYSKGENFDTFCDYLIHLYTVNQDNKTKQLKEIQYTGEKLTKDQINFLLDFFKDRLLEKLGEIKDIHSSLSKLHVISRFPIIPYFFEFLASEDHIIYEHLVLPTWYSTNNKIDIIVDKSTNKRINTPLILVSLNSIFPLFSKFRNYGVENIINTIGQIFLFQKLLSDKIVDKNFYGDIIKKEKENESIKSAIAAVMSRNMSHNVGSHSLVNLGNKNYLEYIFNDELESIKTQFTDTITNKDDDKKINCTKELLRVYNNNLRIRMDLIADIVTSVPTSENTRFLKNDVLAKFTSNYILANTISGTDDFKYQINYKGDGKVSIPNDNLGMDAFSVILENIIRNTAKHGKGNEFIFTMDVEDGNNLPATQFPDYYKITIYENCKNGCNGCKIVAQQNRNINKNVLEDNSYSLRPGAWGVLEMKIAAAYLRKIPPEKIDNPGYQLDISEDGNWINTENDSNQKHKNIPYILKACCKEGQGFGYSFFLMKPKDILIFDYKTDTEVQQLKEKNTLRNHGIKLLQGKDISLNEIYNYRFLVIFASKDKKKEIEGTINKNISGYPNRIIWADDCTKFDLNDSLKTIDAKPNLFKEQIFNHWADQIIEKVEKKYKKDSIEFHEKYFFRIKGKNSFRAYFDDHCKEFFKHLKLDFDYFDFGSSYAASKLHSSNLNELKWDIKLGKKNLSTITVAESFITNIGIVDERLQDFAVNTKYSVVMEEGKDPKPVKFLELFKALNIIFPDKKTKEELKDVANKDEKEYGINLQSSDYSLTAKSLVENNTKKPISIKESIFQWIIKESKELDFLLIHLGILEKILGTTDKEKLKLLFEKEVKNVCSPETKIIIISGRGKPHNLPEGERFLNYSQVAQYISDNQSKYMLTDLCMSSRKTTNN